MLQKSLWLTSGLYLRLTLLTLAVGLLLRIVVLFNEQTSDLSFTFAQRGESPTDHPRHRLRQNLQPVE